jgi:hypothetical protein
LTTPQSSIIYSVRPPANHPHRPACPVTHFPPSPGSVAAAKASSVRLSATLKQASRPTIAGQITIPRSAPGRDDDDYASPTQLTLNQDRGRGGERERGLSPRTDPRGAERERESENLAAAAAVHTNTHTCTLTTSTCRDGDGGKLEAPESSPGRLVLPLRPARPLCPEVCMILAMGWASENALMLRAAMAGMRGRAAGKSRGIPATLFRRRLGLGRGGGATRITRRCEQSDGNYVCAYVCVCVCVFVCTGR